MKNSKKSQTTSDIFWRKHMDENVVDLRKLTQKKSRKKISENIYKSQKATLISSKNGSKRTQPVSDRTKLLARTDAEVPEFFAALKKYKTHPFVPQQSQNYVWSKEKADFLNKDTLSEELSNLDLQDIELQTKLPKLSKTTELHLAQPNLIPPQQEQAYKVQLINEQILPALSKRQQKKLRQKILKDNLLTLAAHQLQDEAQLSFAHEAQKPNSKGKKARRSFVRKFSFAILLFITVGIPLLTLKAFSFKDQAQARAQSAFNFMLEGKDALFNLDAQSAQESFGKAQTEFDKIEQDFEFLSLDFISLAASFPMQSSLGSTAHLIRMGNLFSSAGYQTSQALALLHGLPEFNNGDSEQQSAFTDNIIKASFNLEQARLNIKDANIELSFVRSQDIPEEFQSSILAIQQQSLQIEKLFEQTFSSIDVLLAFLGHQSEKNYLLIFQNSSELRATGGFIGTYGLIQVNKGNVEDLFIDGIYNPDGQLPLKVIPPHPLQYITPNWGTRDSNWFFDFPTSAKKAMWFYEQTGGINTDGVIAITPKVIEKLLAVTGAIDMPEYGLKLTADNFLELVQQEVEVDYDKALNRPKQILTDFAPRLIEKLKVAGSPMTILNIIFEGLNNKDIQIYSEDSSVHDFIANRGWSGELETIDKYEDYLAVVITNIGGWTNIHKQK